MCPLPRSGGGCPPAWEGRWLLLRGGGGSRTKNHRRPGCCSLPPQSGSNIWLPAASQLPSALRDPARGKNDTSPLNVSSPTKWGRWTAADAAGRRGLPDKEPQEARLLLAAPSVRLRRTAPPQAGEHTRRERRNPILQRNAPPGPRERARLKPQTKKKRKRSPT